MSEEREPYRGPRGRRDDTPKLDTYSGRPVGEELPLLECAEIALKASENIIFWEAETRRVAARLPPGSFAPGQPDPVRVREADGLAQLAKLARALAGPDGSRAEYTIPRLKRLVAEAKRRESNP